MKRTGRKQEWSLTMFAFGGLIFFPPVIGLFDKPALILGFPLTYLILFGVWALMIVGIWLGARRSPLRGDVQVDDGGGSREPPFDQASTAPRDRLPRR